MEHYLAYLSQKLSFAFTEPQIFNSNPDVKRHLLSISHFRDGKISYFTKIVTKLKHIFLSNNYYKHHNVSTTLKFKYTFGKMHVVNKVKQYFFLLI